MKSANTAYIERLDHLRFAAAALIVLYHSWLFSDGASRSILQLSLINNGFIGVQLFMVISGFILGIITFGKEIITPKFYWNRVLRIYPLFVVIVALGYFGTPDPRPTSTTFDFLAALLPISNLARLQYGEFGGQFWSIAVELQFYMLFPLLHIALDRKGPTYYLTLIALLITIRLLMFILNGSVYDLSYFSLFGCLDLFLVGHLSGWLYQRSQNRFQRIWLAPAVAVFGVALVWFADGNRLFDKSSATWILWPDVLAIVFGILIPAYIQWPWRIPLSNIWAALGRCSYSIYGWHILTIFVLQKLQLDSLSSYLFGLVSLAASVVIAAASYHVIERPFLERRVRYMSQSNGEGRPQS